jgi:hypothetical protein
VPTVLGGEREGRSGLSPACSDSLHSPGDLQASLSPLRSPARTPAPGRKQSSGRGDRGRLPSRDLASRTRDASCPGCIGDTSASSLASARSPALVVATRVPAERRRDMRFAEIVVLRRERGSGCRCRHRSACWYRFGWPSRELQRLQSPAVWRSSFVTALAGPRRRPARANNGGRDNDTRAPLLQTLARRPPPAARRPPPPRPERRTRALGVARRPTGSSQAAGGGGAQLN